MPYRYRPVTNSNREMFIKAVSPFWATIHRFVVWVSKYLWSFLLQWVMPWGKASSRPSQFNHCYGEESVVTPDRQLAATKSGVSLTAASSQYRMYAGMHRWAPGRLFNIIVCISGLSLRSTSSRTACCSLCRRFFTPWSAWLVNGALSRGPIKIPMNRGQYFRR